MIKIETKRHYTVESKQSALEAFEAIARDKMYSIDTDSLAIEDDVHLLLDCIRQERVVAKKEVAMPRGEWFASDVWSEERYLAWLNAERLEGVAGTLNYFSGPLKENVECKKCDAHGNIVCENCKEGVQKCPRCLGTGAEQKEITETKVIKSEECIVCEGTGVYDCSACKGVGHTQPITCEQCEGGGVIHGVICSKCDGHGRYTLGCKACKGSGEVVCHKCRGAGKLVETKESKATIGEPCSLCCGNKQIVCEACKGKAQVPCDVCRGIKSYSTYTLEEQKWSFSTKQNMLVEGFSFTEIPFDQVSTPRVKSRYQKTTDNDPWYEDIALKLDKSIHPRGADYYEDVVIEKTYNIFRIKFCLTGEEKTFYAYFINNDFYLSEEPSLFQNTLSFFKKIVKR